MPNQPKRRVFLLSPANLSGRRAQMLLREAAAFDLAIRVRETGAPIGEVFSFISGLYFRGKLAYANAFSEAHKNRTQSIFIITATRGLLPPDAQIAHEGLNEMAGVPINYADPRYRLPLEGDLARLAAKIGKATQVVLLGSIATPKYLDPVSKVFGKRLLIPTDFIGRGDMSRGALLLRAVRSMQPLVYAPALTCSIPARNFTASRQAQCSTAQSSALPPST